MANRQFDQYDLTIQKRMVTLFGMVSVSGTTPTLQKWNYPTLGGGGIARTYTAASTATAPTSAGAWPAQYARGTEGIGLVARTNTGLWTVTLQDNYQRLLCLMVHQSIAGGTGNIVQACENTSITNMAAAGGSVIGLALLSATATLADPTSGSTICIMMRLHDATEP